MAPEGLAVSLSAKVLSSSTIGSSTTLGLKLMSIAKMKTAIVSTLIVAGVATPLALHYHSQLRHENATLRGQLLEQAGLVNENQQLSNSVARLEKENSGSLAHDQSELLRLRAEVNRLKQQNGKQIAALRALGAKSNDSRKKTSDPDSQDRDTLVAAEMSRAVVAQKAAADAQASTITAGEMPNGAVTLLKDDAGHQHLMQLTDGQWQEVDPGDSFMVTPEGALAYRGSIGSNSASGGLTHYSFLTNGAPVSVPQ